MTPPPSDRPPGVQSVDRTLDILELLASSPEPVGVTEVSRRLGLAQGTAHRLLGTLVQRGWARHDTGRRYAVGPAAMRVGDAAYRALGSSAGPVLRDAVQATGETANLAVLEGTQMVYVAQAPSPHTLRIFAEVGRRVPLHSTAVGKVALARMAPATRRALLGSGPLPSRTPHTVTAPDRLDTHLARVHEQGFALDDEEQELGVRCVAVPVPLAGLEVSLSVSGPTERMTPEAARAAVPALQRLARLLGDSGDVGDSDSGGSG